MNLIPGLEGYKLSVYYGGPVQPDTIHFLHQYADIPGSLEVLKGVYWGGDFDQIIEMIKTGIISPDKIRFFIGYSGWGNNQLDDEMKEKSWLTVKATRKLNIPP